MIVGPFVNSACIVAGALIGSLVGARLSEDFRNKLILVFSSITLGIGTYMIGKIETLPPVVLSVLAGALCGQFLRLEAAFTKVAAKLAKVFSRGKGKEGSFPQERVQEQFTVLAVIFCASSLGFFGAMREGLTGDSSLLFIKSCLDFPTAMFVAASIGGVVGILAVPQLTVQVTTLLAAGLFTHLTTPAMLGDFSGAGGFIMLATGLRQCGVVQYPVISMMPALILVMPFSAMWAKFIG